jgi:integrase
VVPWAKTLGSEDYIALPQRLATELLEWRKLTPWPEDDDFVFPNSEGGFLDYENFEARVLDPIRKKLGLEKLNFQILRRTFATRAVGEKKGSTKDVQNLFRHTRPDTALENYIKSIPTSVYNMVDAVYESILGVEKKPSQRNLPSGEKKPKNSRWSARSRRLAVMPAAGGVQ